MASRTVAAIGDKQQTRILFDEYVHGYGEHSVPEKSHPIMTALLVQSVVLALAAAAPARPYRQSAGPVVFPGSVRGRKTGRASGGGAAGQPTLPFFTGQPQVVTGVFPAKAIVIS